MSLVKRFDAPKPKQACQTGLLFPPVVCSGYVHDGGDVALCGTDTFVVRKPVLVLDRGYLPTYLKEGD